MRVTSWNFLHGQRLSPAPAADEADAAELGEIFAGFATDLISLQEVDHHLPRSQSCNQSQIAAERVGAKWWGFAPAICGTPGDKWRKLNKSEQRILTTLDHDNQNPYYGISMASKIPVLQWERLELGRSWIGMPLAVGNAKGRLAFIYVKDEPRVAMAAVLDNGWIVINTHLSFVPLVNIYQLFKVYRWAKKLEERYKSEILLTGDLNLPWGIPARLLPLTRATKANSYPSWKPAISFDYILARPKNLIGIKEVLHPQIAFSDHRPISIDI